MKMKNFLTEKLETITGDAPFAYAVTDSKGIILEANRYAIDYIGFRLGTNMIEYDKEKKFADMWIKEVISKGSLTGGMVSYQMQEGNWERFYVNVSSYQDKKDKRYIVWAVNVEELQQQRNAYRRSKFDLKQIVDSLPWPMCIVSPHDVSIYYGNDAFKDCFQFEMESGEECCMWRILPENQSDGKSSKDSMHKFIKKVLEAQASVIAEQEYIMPTGEIVLMRVVGTEIDYDGKPSVSMVLQDVSARKKEEELLRNLVLREREANELKSKFIINMSHEIRTPMNGIIGLSDIQLQKTHNTEIRDAFKKISRSAKHLLAIVNDILDYSKIEADKLTIAKEEFVVENIIYEAMLTAFERIKDKKVEMLLRLEGKAPRKVIGDAVRVWQIMQNVLDNSAKYTDKGSIVIDVLMESETEDEQVLLFRIADTGRGMNKKQLDNIYIPFEQCGKRDLRNGGVGLGLPITKQLVELMGGTIAIESRERQGTVTEIRIPFGMSGGNELAIDTTAYEILKGKKILVIDEAAVGAQISVELLNNVGAQSEGISREENVIGKVEEYGRQSNEFDIIVLDNKIEKDILKALTSYPFTKTKLITMRKPYKPTQFLERLRALLGGAPQAHKIKNKKYHFPRARVLVFEDNAINQDVIMGVLELYGIQTVVASNGVEGIKWLEKEEFDLVIMDILMPVMDGHEATRTIRNSGKPYESIPIVAMTANAMNEEMAVCLEEGMNGYVTKPIELERLYKELLKWLPVSVREEAVDIVVKSVSQDIEQEDRILSQRMDLERLGIGAEEATERFGGKYELYSKSLRKFAGDIVQNGMMDSAEAADSELDELRKYIHGLKGVTANLSMKEANRLLQEIEKTIKAGEADMGLYQQLFKHLNEVSQGILQIIGREQEHDLGLGNWKECKNLLTQLKEFLLLAKARESEQIILRLREKTWENVDVELLEKICSAVEEYDYAKGLTILGQLL